MNVSLTPELERFVNQRLRSGMYGSASEVIRAALRLLKEREKLVEARLADLRQEIAVGIEQADRGELVEGAELFAKLRRKAPKRSPRTR